MKPLPSKVPLGRLIFLLGHPISQSFSPNMQNAGLRHIGLPWLYLPLDLLQGQVRPFVKLMRDLPVQGANVTVPYKGVVLGALDSVDPAARLIGSVNTIYRKGKKLFGTSTDGQGFLRSLGAREKRLFRSSGLLLGSGGAGKAVAFALASRGIATLWIANRSSRSAEELARALRKHYPALSVQSVSFREAEAILPRCDWAVQATSLGLRRGDKSPISLAKVRPSAWVVDLIYHRETAFLKEARKRCVPGWNGSGMLLYQGILSFEHWTGQKAPEPVMRRCLLEQLSKQL